MTFYFIHDQRGKAGMDAAGILPQFENIAIHDHWESYQHYECDHGFCSTHHIAIGKNTGLWSEPSLFGS